MAAQQENPPKGAGLRFELGPSLEKDSALATQIRYTLLGYAAHFISINSQIYAKNFLLPVFIEQKEL